MRLKLVMEDSTEYVTGKKITFPQDAEEIFKGMGLDSLDHEVFAVIGTDIRAGMIYAEIISIGTDNASLIDPSSVFRGAILKGAKGLIIGHNHPSGDPTPSKEDLRVTRSLIDAGEILQIKVNDHIIIPHKRGADYIISLRESGLVEFK